MSDTPHHRLGFSQGFAQVEALHADLLALLQGAPDEVVIDGHEVEQVDVSSLQVLAAFARDLRDQGGRLAWQRPSPRLIRVARLTGLAPVLGLPAEDT